MATRTSLPKEQGPSTEETSFIEGDTQGQRVLTMQEEMAWREVSGEFPDADRRILDVKYKVTPRAGGGGGGAITEVKMRNKTKWYRLYTKSRGASQKSFNEHLPQGIKAALGKSLDDEIDATNAALEEKQKELQAKQKQKQQLEQTLNDTQKLRRDMDAIRNRIKQTEDQIQELEDAHGPLNTEEIQRLKNEKKKS